MIAKKPNNPSAQRLHISLFHFYTFKILEEVWSGDNQQSQPKEKIKKISHVTILGRETLTSEFEMILRGPAL